MIFYYSTVLLDWFLAQESSERLCPAAGGRRCRDSQTTIMQSWGNTAEEGEEGAREIADSYKNRA